MYSKVLVLTLITITYLTTIYTLPTTIPGEVKSANLEGTPPNFTKTVKPVLLNATKAHDTVQKQITDSIKKIVSEQQKEEASNKKEQTSNNKNYHTATIHVQAKDYLKPAHSTQSDSKYYPNQKSSISQDDVQTSESKFYPVVQSKTYQNYQNVQNYQEVLPHTSNYYNNTSTSFNQPFLLPKYEQQDTEKLSKDELKIKCQHLSKLLSTGTTEGYVLSSTAIPPLRNTAIAPLRNTRRPTDIRRPVYIHNRPVFPSGYGNPKPGGFYVTSQTLNPFFTTPKRHFTSTTLPPTTSLPPLPISLSTQIKYIRLEPVILQKTILNDGRVLYFWHKSLPTTVEQPNNNGHYYSTPSNFVVPQQGPDSSGQSGPTNYASIQEPNKSSGYQSFPINLLPQHTTETLTPYESSTTDSPYDVGSTSTTEYSSYIGFLNFLPFYGGQSSEESIATSSTTQFSSTTTTTTTPRATKATKNEDKLHHYHTDSIFSQQLKFVVPVPINDDNFATARTPWDFDPFAYYPKGLQPTRVKVEVPYTPNFHVIKSLTIPSTQIEKQERLDDVSL